MSEEHVIPIVIAVAAAVALLAGILWLFVFGRRPMWPAGLRDEATYRGHRAVVIWHPSFRPTDEDRHRIPLQIAKAAWVTARAWREFRNEDITGDLETIGAWILPDSVFNEETRKALPHRDPVGVSAWLSKAPQRLGNGPPMPVLRVSHLDIVERRGQPTIHELLHSLGGLYYDQKHETPDVWEHNDGETQIEERAEELFGIVANLGPGAL